MTDQITEYALNKECETIAADIFSNMLDDMADDETPEDHRDDMSDRAHEAVDGHQWVIYHYWSHRLCLECDTDEGEAFLEDVGMPETPTYDNLATAIAYGEMLARVSQAVDKLIKQWDEEHKDAA